MKGGVGRAAVTQSQPTPVGGHGFCAGCSGWGGGVQQGLFPCPPDTPPPLALPTDLLRMFFDALYDEDVIKEEAFYKWESSKDPAEQQGKGVALKSVTAFFTWLREAEDESDNN